jgi:DHA3 family macrolide efflux protein-like MFS transporter
MPVFHAHANAKHWARLYFTIWTGQAISLLGSQLVQFALVWWLTKTTGSAVVLATATLAAMLPQVALGPLAGALVDRWNRRILMMAADTSIALATLALAGLFWAGAVQVWHVYLLMALRSVGGIFHWSAMQSSTSLMAPEKHLARLQGLNQMLNGGLSILSAPLGALLLELLPMQGILGIDVFTALLAVIPLLFIGIPQPARSDQAAAGVQPATLWSEMQAGLRYVLGWRGLVIIGVMAALINFLLTPASSLLPLLVTRHFAGQALQLAWMESALGIGVIAGGLFLGVWGGFRNRVMTSMAGLLLIGLSSLLVGLLPATLFPVAVLGMFLLGFAGPITNGPLMAALQAVVAPNMQGRVFTLINSFASVMTPLGLLLAGPLADTFTVQAWYVWGGVLTIFMAIFGGLTPAVVRFEQDHRAAQPPLTHLSTVTPQPAEGD